MRLDQTLDVEMGEKHLCVHQNGGEISSGNLCRGGLCDPIEVGIFEMREERYETSVFRSGESSVGNLFASSFIWEIENPPSHCSSSKYISGK